MRKAIFIIIGTTCFIGWSYAAYKAYVLVSADHPYWAIMFALGCVSAAFTGATNVATKYHEGKPNTIGDTLRAYGKSTGKRERT